MFPVMASCASGPVFPGGSGPLAITESPDLLPSECRVAIITGKCVCIHTCMHAYVKGPLIPLAAIIFPTV